MWLCPHTQSSADRTVPQSFKHNHKRKASFSRKMGENQDKLENLEQYLATLEKIHKPRQNRVHNGSDEYIITNTPEATTTIPGCALLWKKFEADFDFVSELSLTHSQMHLAKFPLAQSEFSLSRYIKNRNNEVLNV